MALKIRAANPKRSPPFNRSSPADLFSAYTEYVVVASCRVLVAFWFLAFRQLDAVPRYLFIRKQAQQMRDTVEPRAAFVVSGHDVPRRDFRISCGDHLVPRARVVVPAPM